MPSKITAPRGTQDILPPRLRRWLELEARIHALAARFGYGEIRTPMFEATELFVRGVGETTDIVEKEMYTFVDKGDRSMTLRPEWTAPVMRAALEHNLFAQGPQRLYYVGPIFRYERPQKGRYRQAHQFGVECSGFAGPGSRLRSDLARVGAGARATASPMRTLQLNSIGDEVCRPRYREALLAHFRPHLAELSRGFAAAPRAQSAARARQQGRARPRAGAQRADVRVGAVRCVSRTLRRAARLSRCRADSLRRRSAIVRGLDYYTRTVFEITSSVLGAQSHRLRRRSLRRAGALAWRSRRARRSALRWASSAS